MVYMILYSRISRSHHGRSESIPQYVATKCTTHDSKKGIQSTKGKEGLLYHAHRVSILHYHLGSKEV